MMEAKAIARYVRISPTKADRVLRQIRGLQVERAQEILAYSPRPIAKQVGKVLTSAVANATNREQGAAPDLLYVKTAVADAGPTLKRIQPRAQGRAYRILKRSSHITIVVAERGVAEKVAVAAGAPGAAPEAKPTTAGRIRAAIGRRTAGRAKPAKPAEKTGPKRKTGAAKKSS
jgi:large subunit ribosomal protein L22